jgi:hypothetical protein
VGIVLSDGGDVLWCDGDLFVLLGGSYEVEVVMIAK